MGDGVGAGVGDGVGVGAGVGADVGAGSDTASDVGWTSGCALSAGFFDSSMGIAYGADDEQRYYEPEPPFLVKFLFHSILPFDCHSTI